MPVFRGGEHVLAICKQPEQFTTCDT